MENSILNLVNGDREHSKYGISHTIQHELITNNYAEELVKIYKSNCRICSNKNLITYLSLGLSPLANNLVSLDDKNIEKFPLELNLCTDCFNSQLSVVVPRRKMFDKYLYLSSTTKSFKAHFNELANTLINQFNLSKNSFVVDIGSTDGILLKPL